MKNDPGFTTELIPEPPAGDFVVVIEPTAHLDWDWLNCFPYNVDQSLPPGVPVCKSDYFETVKRPGNEIYASVAALLKPAGTYRYSSCEISFLRKFAESDPIAFSGLVTNSRFRIVGGGITSPDNLLSNGECFLRCFLVGLDWMRRQGLAWTKQVWIPDDFGQDSQLPALLVAMGATGVGFARVPGGAVYNGNLSSAQPAPMAGQILNTPPDAGGGLDFYWQASDGSTLFAHWMPNGYSQAYSGGNRLYGSDIERYVEGDTGNRVGSPTPYVHVPSCWDFGKPTPDLQLACDEYNATQEAKPEQPRGKAVIGTFDQYAASVQHYARTKPQPLETRTFAGSTTKTSFRSNPYFMGFYGSRMALKRLHNEATRTLLAAELYDTLLSFWKAGTDRPARLAVLWDDLVPSTHHDYITGTATDCVYLGEQLPLLSSVVSKAAALLAEFQGELAADMRGSASRLVVFNSIGVARTGIVEVSAAEAPRIDVSGAPVQALTDGRLLVWGGSRSLGYEVFRKDLYPAPPLVTIDGFGQPVCTLANGKISVEIDQSQAWGISRMTNLETGIPLLAGTGNYLKVFDDGGSIYSFGYECGSPSFSDLRVTWTGQPLKIVEGRSDGSNLRLTVAGSVTATINGSPCTFTLSYSLSAGEPFVRIALTGVSPANASVFAYFPIPGSGHRLEHGTPYHWDTKFPATFGTNPDFNAVFEPTHDFVTVLQQSNGLLTVFHGDVPPWSLAMDGRQPVLVGCLLRSNDPQNEGCDGRGAAGQDRGQHTIRYALRAGGHAASTGIPLQEARSCSSPLIGRLSAGDGEIPNDNSLGSTASNRGFITAVKRGTAVPSDIYMRVYDAKIENRDQDHVMLHTPLAENWEVKGETAMETPLSPEEEQAFRFNVKNGTVNMMAPRSISTLRFRRIR